MHQQVSIDSLECSMIKFLQHYFVCKDLMEISLKYAIAFIKCCCCLFALFKYLLC